MNSQNEQLPIPHPGETLLEDFMKPLKLTVNRLARELGVRPDTVGGIVRGRRSVTPAIALRLARYTGTSPEFWLGLQEDFDLRHAERKMSRRIEREVKPCPLLKAAAAA